MNKPLALAAVAAFSLTAVASGAAFAQDRAAAIQEALAAADRTQPELDRDARRRPALSLEASPVQAGDRVLDLSSGPGYMVRLYSSLVGPEGHVTAQNPAPSPETPPQFAERLAQMSATIDAMIAERGNVDHMQAPAGALTAEDGSYDVVSITLSYHDRVNAGDAEAMNAEAFRVLKPGGYYFIVDHAAPEGTGSSLTQERHQIEEAFVRQQVEAAGFVFESESDALIRTDLPASGERDDAGSSQFAMTFVKPAS